MHPDLFAHYVRSFGPSISIPIVVLIARRLVDRDLGCAPDGLTSRKAVILWFRCPQPSAHVPDDGGTPPKASEELGAVGRER